MAHYLNKSLNVHTQDSNPCGIAISSDGTVLLVVGNVNKTVFQYTLSTPFDLSTGTYATKSFSVNTQDTNPLGMCMDPTGTIMYILGNTNKSVFQYTLGTPFDISTASYASKTFVFTTQDTSPEAIVLSIDGTLMYMTGNTNNRIFEYTLSTPFDVSTAVYSTKSFLGNSQHSGSLCTIFNNDLTRMYVIGNSPSTVFQYTLTTAGDVSTTVFASKLFTPAEAATPLGMAFNELGTVLYISDFSSSIVYQYALSMSFDVQTVESIATIRMLTGFSKITF